MLIGYTRIAKVQPEEDLQIQQKSLMDYGCSEQNIYREKTINGAPQPELKMAINALRKGDKFVVDHLSRFGYDISDIGKILEKIEEKYANLVVLDLGGNLMDSSTKSGLAMLKAVQAIAALSADASREKKLEDLVKTRKNYKRGT
tara:strand:+ start:1201 stop:1635 length:435 start_codon:yes stop_codon:yes gene_type:complete